VKHNLIWNRRLNTHARHSESNRTSPLPSQRQSNFRRILTASPGSSNVARASGQGGMDHSAPSYRQAGWKCAIRALTMLSLIPFFICWFCLLPPLANTMQPYLSELPSATTAFLSSNTLCVRGAAASNFALLSNEGFEILTGATLDREYMQEGWVMKFHESITSTANEPTHSCTYYVLPLSVSLVPNQRHTEILSFHPHNMLCSCESGLLKDSGDPFS